MKPSWLNHFFLFFFSLSCSILCFATETNPNLMAPPPKPKLLTLDAAVWLALRYNPNVRNEEINRVEQAYNLVVARNQFELQYALNGTSNYTYTHIGQNISGGASSINTTSVTPATSLNLPSGGNVSVSMANTLNGPNSVGNPKTYNPSLNIAVTQPLIRGFGEEVTLTPLANAYDSERINRLNLRGLIMSTITKVITDYYTVVQNQENLAAQKATLDDVKKRYADNLIKIKAGKIPPSDNVQAQVDVSQAELGYTSAEYSLVQSKLTLLNDIGLAPNENIIVDPNLNAKDYLIPTIDGAKNLVIANDVTYQTSVINRRIDQRSVVVAQDNQRAQLNLTVAGTTGANNGSAASSGFESLTNGSNQTGSVALTLNVPIDDVTLQQATLNAKGKVQQDDITIKNQEWVLETTTINSINNMTTLKAQVGMAKTAMDMQLKALQETEIKRKFGMASALDVSIQQNNLTSARLTYISTEINYLTAMLQFRQLIGQTLEDWHVQVHY